MKLLNEKLSEFRRQLYRQATYDLHKQVLKEDPLAAAQASRKPGPQTQ